MTARSSSDAPTRHRLTSTERSSSNSRTATTWRLSRATDFYSLDELLTDREREIRDRVRLWCDTEVSPIAADYWERAEFPVELVPGYGQLGIAGASIVGDGCPGLSYLAEGMIAAELARGDGSIATLNAVHSGLAMTTIAHARLGGAASAVPAADGDAARCSARSR